MRRAIGVDDEGDVDEALPGRDVGEVRQPERVRARRVELPVHPVERAGDGRVADGGADLAAAHDALQAHLPHQPGDRAARDLLSLPPELPPHLAHAVDAEVRVEHAPDVGRQDDVAPGPGRQPGRVGAPGAWAWYVDGAIGSTLQIGSTPWAPR